MIELELPWPPSVNHYKRVGRTTVTKSGKFYQSRINSDETNLFYHSVGLRIAALNASERLKFSRSEKILVDMQVYLYPPDKRRRDVDNGLKALLDSLVRHQLIKDDFQIARLLVVRKDTITHGKVIIRLKDLEQL